MSGLLRLFAGFGLATMAAGIALVEEKVTVDNFVRAQTDVTMSHYVKDGAFGAFLTSASPWQSTSKT